MKLYKLVAFSIGPIGSAILGLVTLPLVAWFFSPEDLGRLSMLQLVLSFSVLLFSLGLDQAYVREFHEVIDKSALFKSVLTPGLSVLASFLVCLVLMPWSLSEILFEIDATFISGLLVLSVFLSFLSRFLSLILRMQGRGIAFSMSQLLPKLIFLLIILLYIYKDFDDDFENLILANVFSLFIVFSIFAFNTRNEWISALSAKIDKEKQLVMIKYAFPLIGSGIAFWGLTATDRILIRSLSTFEELGIYSVSMSFAAAALVFQTIFSTVWAPIVYKWVSDEVDPEKIKIVIDYVVLTVIALWSLTIIFSWLINYILPIKYEKVQCIVLSAIAYPLLYTLSESTSVGIGIKRKTLFSMLAAIVALLTNIIGNWFLIPYYGAAGAAISTSFAFFVFFIIRTEISSNLWISFPRIKIYIFILVGLILSTLFNLYENDFLIRIIFGFIYLFSGLCFYKNQLVQCKIYIRNIIKRY